LNLLLCILSSRLLPGVEQALCQRRRCEIPTLQADWIVVLAATG